MNVSDERKPYRGGDYREWPKPAEKLATDWHKKTRSGGLQPAPQSAPGPPHRPDPDSARQGQALWDRETDRANELDGSHDETAEAMAQRDVERRRAERAEAKLRELEGRNATARPVSVPPEKKLQWALGEWIWSICKRQGVALLLGGAALTWTSVRPAPLMPPSKDEEVYAAVRAEVIRVNEAQRVQAADLAELRAWIKGYLQATGVKVVDPPGAAIEPKTVELAPSPLPSPHRLGRAPEVQVRTPLPAPRPVPEPVRLPENIDALPRAP